MPNNHGFTRHILEDIEEAAKQAGIAEEALKKLKIILDSAVLREMNNKRKNDSWRDFDVSQGSV